MVETKSRVDYIDITKGLLIILVVLGHSAFEYSNIIFWFHMPAFFFISGLLHKQPQKKDFRKSAIRKSISLLVPYFAFGLIITLLLCLIEKFTSTSIIPYLFKRISLLIYGGRALVEVFAVFWFITCLLLTYITFTLLNYILENSLYLTISLLFIFVLAYYIHQYISFPIPWNIDIVPFALLYYGFGFSFSKSIIKLLQNKTSLIVTFIITLSCSILLINLKLNELFNFSLDMKNGLFSNLVLALIIPFIFTAFFLSLSALISQTLVRRLLIFIGVNSLLIMYLHMAIKKLFQLYLHDQPYEYYVILGVILPLLLFYVIDKSKMSQFLFLGKNCDLYLEKFRTNYFRKVDIVEKDTTQ